MDSDAIAAIEAMAHSYQTLSNGLYYEKPPDLLLQRRLFDALKAAIEKYKKEEVQQLGLIRVRDADIRDTLIFLTQLGAARSNGRPKGRAYLDLLRRQFKSAESLKAESNLIVMP